ncbi:MAG TPA: hypothetical protein VGO53_15125 [Steroidobacteraceae bacterium]|jgi:hypothetical protein|nr:hypothetical protein [Steroidobacteraceae bacterium]
MPSTDISFARSFQIWWSYAWRTSILMIPVVILGSIMSGSLMAGDLTGSLTGEDATSLHPNQLAGVLARLMLVWLLIMVLSVLVQVQAMRWMLKTRFKGFRLEAVEDR